MVLFKFNNNHFIVEFNIHEGFAECEISHECGSDEYETLNIQDKTFIADKANTEKENHCIVLAFNDNIKLRTSFYFTNKNMLLNLFSQHFEEMTASLDIVIELTCDKLEQQKMSKNHRIGFKIEQQSPYTTESAQAQNKNQYMLS